LDLLDLAILALRIALVAVLYVFLVIVLRAAGRGLQAARPEPATRALRLIVLDAGSSDLTAGEAIDVADGTTLGRAERADVVLADAAVSAEHVRLGRDGRNWVVLDLASTNGTLVNNQPIHGQTRLNQGDVLALGSVRLQVALRPSTL
jgi:hypothetical protein